MIKNERKRGKSSKEITTRKLYMIENRKVIGKILLLGKEKHNSYIYISDTSSDTDE